MNEKKSIRTENRIKKRALLKEIINLLIDLETFSDNKLERIKMPLLMNIKISLLNIHKWFNLDDRYMHGTHIYTNHRDALAKVDEKNQILTNVKKQELKLKRD